MSSGNRSVGDAPSLRHYDDAEIASLLARATELQSGHAGAARQLGEAGLTLTELMDVAREVGIDPDMLRRAAADLEFDMGPRTVGDRLAGGQLTVRRERVVAGELSAERLEAIIPLIEHATGARGIASTAGGTLTWRSDSTAGGSSRRVMVASQEGRTSIQWEEKLTGLAGGLFGGLVAGGGVGLGLAAAAPLLAAGSTLPGIGVPIALGACTYGLARSIYGRIVRRREATARRLIEQITRYIESLRIT